MILFTLIWIFRDEKMRKAERLAMSLQVWIRWRPLNHPMEGAAFAGKAIHKTGDVGWFLQRRGMVWLIARVNNHWPRASPMLVLQDGAYAINICRWIRFGENIPQKVFLTSSSEIRIIHQNHPGESRKFSLICEGCAETSQS